ncbi:hypothetical protein DL93DRAFT_2080681 [Clavulina sp. PMI_390]|nr:hypothetical protein DL93DRAFT_2080681 [Clavulina sp. PMI_390]
MYAKPTKEWVIPPKPRPGRKLKKDSVPVDVDDDDEEAKKVQNRWVRAAQRAFRERKQSQLADLQARLAQYERGEIERNVALQNAAKRLKDENDLLRKENVELKARLEAASSSSLCSLCSSKRSSLKRVADVELDGANDVGRGRSITAGSSKRMRSARAPSTVSSVTSWDSSHLPSTSEASSSLATSSTISSVSTSFVGGDSDRRSPLPTSPDGTRKIPQPSQKHPASLYAPSHDVDMTEEMNLADIEVLDCGLCSLGDSCLCREVVSSASQTIQLEPAPVEETKPATRTDSSSSSSILDHLPPFAPAVPLRRNKAKAPAVSATERWIVTPAPIPSSSREPSDEACTGDPANCPACADDPANQAFCAALGDAYSGGEEDFSSATATPPPTQPMPPPASAPRRSVHFLDASDDMDMGDTAPIVPTPRLSVLALCCGDPSICGGPCAARSGGDSIKPLDPLPSCSSMEAGPSTYSQPSSSSSLPSSSNPSKSQDDGQMVPCNTAWRQLSSHPNIAFADLSLLADVVSRRDHIPVPNRQGTPSSSSSTSSSKVTASSVPEPNAVLPSNARLDGSRTLVPHDHLVMNGHRRRVRQVPNDGVQDALALLDGVRSLT